MTIAKGDCEIHSLEQWADLAGPKRSTQWVDGRSAKEMARAWLECSHQNLPQEVVQVIASNSSFGKVSHWTAEPEAKLCFDNFQGEPRNTDLLGKSSDQTGLFLIAVEAKADEPFGELVGDALAAGGGATFGQRAFKWCRSDRPTGPRSVCATQRRRSPAAAHSVPIDDGMRRCDL